MLVEGSAKEVALNRRGGDRHDLGKVRLGLEWIAELGASSNGCVTWLLRVATSKWTTLRTACTWLGSPRTATWAGVSVTLPGTSRCPWPYRKAAGDGIQVHGGIGFTWEHDMHLYFKRPKASEVTLGDATYHRELVAQALDL